MPTPGPVLTYQNTAKDYVHRILIGTPTLGQVRMEWHNAMGGLVIPCNWSNSMVTPLGFRTDDAQNLIVRDAIEQGFEFLLLLEDDVLPPSDLLLRLNAHMTQPISPLISGLVHVKPGLFSSGQPEPMIYRGRGNGAFRDWTPGDKVWCDGLPTGCLLIDGKLLRAVWEASEFYTLTANGQASRLRRVFEAPRKVFSDVALPSYKKVVGTSDIYFCDRVLKEGHLAASGWKALTKKRYPFVVDTGIRCGHIDRSTGAIIA